MLPKVSNLMGLTLAVRDQERPREVVEIHSTSAARG